MRSSFSFMFQLLKLIICLAIVPASAQSSSSDQNQNDDDMYNPKFSPSMGIIIIVLISSLFLMGFFSIYIRNCAGGDYSTSAAAAAGGGGGSRRSRRGTRGLDPAVIESFPTFQYSSVRTLHLGKGALECAVCLNEFEDDNETLRLIPNCDHVFHPECIDAWLSAHTTCPVCRADLLNPHPHPLPLPLELQGGESVHAPLHQISEHIIDVDVDVDAHVIEPTSTSNTQQQSQEEQEETKENAKVSEVSATAAAAEIKDKIQTPITNPIILNRNRTTIRSSRNNNNNIINDPWSSRSRSMSVRPPRWLRMFNRSNSTGHLPIRHWDPTDMDRFTLRVPDQVRKQIMMMNRTTSCVAVPRERVEEEGEGANRSARSDRWVFSLAPPFFSRAPSVRVAADGTAGSTSGSISGSSVSGSGSVKGSLHLPSSRLP